MTTEASASAGRKAYCPPRLSLLGDVSSMTESGSGPGSEAMRGPFGCTSDTSMTGAMC